MDTNIITPESLAAAAAILLSLGFSYVPKLNTWFAVKDETSKRLIMLGLLIVVAAGAYGLACANILTDLFGVTLACTQKGALELGRALIVAIIVNQGAYSISPRTKSVRAVKEGKAVG